MVIVAVMLAGNAAHAQVSALVWEDDFNNLDNWIKLTGNGSWGWGNGELEFYSESNVGIAEIPGEPGNMALRIIARQENGNGGGSSPSGTCTTDTTAATGWTTPP